MGPSSRFILTPNKLTRINVKVIDFRGIQRRAGLGGQSRLFQGLSGPPLGVADCPISYFLLPVLFLFFQKS